MNIKRYVDSSSHRAMRRIREEMGDDVVILSTSEVPGGIEFVVSAEADAEAAAAPARQVQPPQFQTLRESPDAAAQPAPEAAPKGQDSGLAQRHFSDASPREAWSQNAEILSLKGEMEQMRSTLEQRLHEQQWAAFDRNNGNPHRWLEDLKTLGFDSELAATLAERIPANEPADLQREMLKMLLSRQLPITTAPTEGVIIFAGPAGSGKTTTIAKLAAREVMAGNAEEIAILSADTARVGAQEQLRGYCRILQMPLHVAEDTAKAATIMRVLSSRRLVLVDTGGISYRDRGGMAAVKALRDALPGSRLCLTLPADRETHALRETVNHWQALEPDFCALTRIDESAAMGGLLSLLANANLPVSWCCEGPRVPQDIYAADSMRIVNAALSPVTNENYKEDSNVQQSGNRYSA